MDARRVPVLIVGGSLVGLSMSVLLAARGVRHVLVERHRGTAIHPRAAAFHQRTMEIFRELGLQEAVEAAAEQEFVQNGAIVAVESLAGKELKYFFSSFNAGVEHLSPTPRIFLTQVGLEPLLRGRAEELGAEHRFGTELVDFEQRDDGVACVLRPRQGGAEATVLAQYVVAADGAHSGVRQRLGIDLLGPGAFADCVTIYFHADVKELLGVRNLSVVYVNNPELLGFFRFSITADSGFLAVFATTGPDGTPDRRVGRDTSTARCINLVRTALGVPDLPVEIDNVQRWAAEAGHAARYRAGRVFLAGDAAHVMPPTGGFGGNTGVADAHNLAWKLAMTLDGVAGPGLLDSYEAERAPIGRLTTEQAYVRYVLRVDPSLSTDDLPAQLDEPSIELGALYRSAAVTADDPEPAPSLDDPNHPTGRIGARAPHLPIELAGRHASTLDLVGPGFTLLAAPDGEAWCQAAGEVAAALGVPLTAHRVAGTGPVVDPTGRFAATFGLGPAGAVLIRPDGVIAWRGDHPTGDHGERLSRVMSALLSR
ncbi:MAG TPA: FAD-dependent monooxygenase [Actinophytocola sp.]|uniref:FAD-dependent monooxygenase n=1 Tax=Actinophytocola sp. TaxID=1872138 RepID=UPI002DDCCA27|nr:FAD-dependent monooxygenase [Actinophytocola sp.]HEV2782709.1 FAD-dependent monooxygenase [Actinophytocola sp.]